MFFDDNSESRLHAPPSPPEPIGLRATKRGEERRAFTHSSDQMYGDAIALALTHRITLDLLIVQNAIRIDRSLFRFSIPSTRSHTSHTSTALILLTFRSHMDFLCRTPHDRAFAEYNFPLVVSLCEYIYINISKAVHLSILDKSISISLPPLDNRTMAKVTTVCECNHMAPSILRFANTWHGTQ